MFRGIIRKIKQSARRNSIPNLPSASDFPARMGGNAPKSNHVDFYYIYVLRLSNGGYYVGITNQPQRRLKEHMTGKGSKITHTYPPRMVVMCKELGYMNYGQAEFQEDLTTLTLMVQYGYSCVRGGHWSMLNDKAIVQALKRQDKYILTHYKINIRALMH